MTTPVRSNSALQNGFFGNAAPAQAVIINRSKRPVSVGPALPRPTGTPPGTLRRQEPLAGSPVSRLMAELAIHPPVHLVTHPDEPVRSLEAAAKIVRRHAGEPMERATEG